MLKNGEVLGFETDTVWGLGCNPNDEEGVDKIYEIKGRDRSKPLILMSNSLSNLIPYVNFIPDYAKTLIDRHFPGALTLIFEKSPLTKDFITSGKNTVGIRIPNHKGFQDLCAQIEGGVLATTSLNISNEPPAANYNEAYNNFSKYVTVIKPENSHHGVISGVSSTVVLCTGEAPVVLRQGSVKI